MYLTYFCVYVVADLRSSFGVFPKYFLQNMGHRTKRILRIERKEYQTY